MGVPKQLLAWEGEAMVRRAARAALEGGLDPVVVLTGAGAEAVEQALSGLRVAIRRCADWTLGQSVSIRAGLAHALELRSDLDGAAFLLCDQPYVDAEVVREVVELHAKTLAPACAPFIDGRRCNPVLFSKALFPALMALSGDAGGRTVLNGVALARLDWKDPRLGEDFDTPDEYNRMHGDDLHRGGRA
jgi:molybdenum cofactor cytidylyltransferase